MAGWRTEKVGPDDRGAVLSSPALKDRTRRVSALRNTMRIALKSECGLIVSIAHSLLGECKATKKALAFEELATCQRVFGLSVWPGSKPKWAISDLFVWSVSCV